MMITMWSSHVALIMLKYVPFSPILFKTFIMKSCWCCQTLFLHQLRWSCDFCLLCGLLHLLSCICWSIPASPGKKPTWSREDNLFYIYLILIYKEFIEPFQICIYWGYWPVGFIVFTLFGYYNDTCFTKEFWNTHVFLFL